MVDLAPVKTLPSQLTSGDVVLLDFAELRNAYPDPDYSINIILKIDTNVGILEGLDASGAAKLDLTNAQSGIWNYEIRVTNVVTTASRSIKSGIVNIVSGLAAGDPRSHAQKTLDALEAIIENRATKDQQSYSIAGRSLTRMSIDELLKFRDRYRKEVQAEIRSKLPNKGRRATFAKFR